MLTRLAVTYDLMPLQDIRTIVKMAHDKGAIVYVDNAGGARVDPALFDQPRLLDLGVDIGATGLDKYGTIGPRFGLMAGERDRHDHAPRPREPPPLHLGFNFADHLIHLFRSNRSSSDRLQQICRVSQKMNQWSRKIRQLAPAISEKMNQNLTINES